MVASHKQLQIYDPFQICTECIIMESLIHSSPIIVINAAEREVGCPNIGRQVQAQDDS
jgi:hypothetical protein